MVYLHTFLLRRVFGFFANLSSVVRFVRYDLVPIALKNRLLFLCIQAPGETLQLRV